MMIRWLFTLLALLVTSSGCSHLISPKKANLTERGRSVNTAPGLSPWYYESLALCESSRDYNPLTSENLEVSNGPVTVSHDIWDRVRQGFKLPPVPYAKIQKYIGTYGRHPNYMLRVSKQSEKYLFYVVDQLDKRNMPMELALIPVIESGYNPRAMGKGGPSGLWQFLPSTGRHLGIAKSAWYNGAFDVTASTNAALDYLETLNKRYNGDWMLTLAAYNLGWGALNTAIERNRAAGKPTDYWSLKVATHTQEYIPRLLAIRELITHSNKYNVKLTPIENQPYFTQIQIKQQVSLNQVASWANSSVAEICDLNTGYVKGATDPSTAKYIAIPTAKTELFWANINRQPAINPIPVLVLQNNTAPKVTSPTKINSASSTVKHQVKPGDSLWEISRKYKVSMAQLTKWNNLGRKPLIKPGQTLVVMSGSTQ